MKSEFYENLNPSDPLFYRWDFMFIPKGTFFLWPPSASRGEGGPLPASDSIKILRFSFESTISSPLHFIELESTKVSTLSHSLLGYYCSLYPQKLCTWELTLFQKQLRQEDPEKDTTDSMMVAVLVFTIWGWSWTFFSQPNPCYSFSVGWQPQLFDSKCFWGWCW